MPGHARARMHSVRFQKGLLSLCCRTFRCALILLHEFFDAAGRVNQLLFAGEEGMALRADFNALLANGAAHPKGIAACAGDRAQPVIGMDVFFHFDLQT